MSDEYARALTRQAVARACVALGFKQSNQTVLDALADVVRQYVQSIGYNAAEISDVAGRVQPGIQDFMSILGDPNKADHWVKLRDFAFESKQTTGSSSSALGSSSVKWNQPFPHPVPDFPIRQRPRATAVDISTSTTTSSSSSANRPSHIPDFLPPFPPAHTYKKTIPTSTTIVKPKPAGSGRGAGAGSVLKKRPASAISATSAGSRGGGQQPQPQPVSAENDDPAQRRKRIASIRSVQESLAKIEDSTERTF